MQPDPDTAIRVGDLVKDYLGREGVAIVVDPSRNVIQIDYGKQPKITDARYGSWRYDTVSLVEARHVPPAAQTTRVLRVRRKSTLAPLETRPDALSQQALPLF